MALEKPNDPLHSTAAEVSRRGFVSLSAGALTIATTAAASAQNDYGRPHPPIVAEDDPAIAVSRPRLTPAAGGAIGSYAAIPRVVTARTPGVVVIQHGWGLDTSMRDVVRRLAKAGFIAIAPALYDRLNPPSGDGATDFAPFAAFIGKMYAQGFLPTDVIAAHDWISTQARDTSIGITGFCVGGGIVLQSVVDSKGFAAASMFYGNVRPGSDTKQPAKPSDFDFTSRITTPLLGSFGARDTSIKPDDVRAMFARLSAPHDVKIYDEAGHAFMDDQRDSYVPSAATDAWTRTLGWFHKYLG
ncbi:MAG: dienelactone hydrolase family protein [Candidatus Eremiobacteraeota bacterium]|nr:dienelactone hydrolase family protein [Candidatus Eremiobacteraeota bacterium]